MKQGRLLCSFELIDPSVPIAKVPPMLHSSLDYFAIPFPISPVTRPTTIEIIFWGIRSEKGLKSMLDALLQIGGQNLSKVVAELGVLKLMKVSNTLTGNCFYSR